MKIHCSRRLSASENLDSSIVVGNHTILRAWDSKSRFYNKMNIHCILDCSIVIIV